MYIIPTIESKIDRNKPTILQSNHGGIICLQPSIYTVSQILPVLYGYTVDLASVFVTPPSSIRVIGMYNNTDAITMSLGGSIGVLGINNYIRRLNSLTALVGTIDTTITATFVVFTTMYGLETDISEYTNRGCILEQVNITGHIAAFSSAAGTCILDNSILTKINLPLPVAFKFVLQVNLADLIPYTVYDLPTNPGQIDYVLYQGIEYSRSRISNPIPHTFTTRSNGALLWI